VSRRKDSDEERWLCARCDFDARDVCECACHTGGAFRPACDVPGGCGRQHGDPATSTVSRDELLERLAEHARDSQHWLCPCCLWSLTEQDPTNACEHCLTDARRLLQRIGLLYDLLPAELSRLRSGLGVYGGSGSEELPLPGGDVLVLMGAGSAGLSEDAVTDLEGEDLSSVSFELGWWAIDWQDTLGEHEPLGHRPAVIVRRASGYLERKARWAAQEHPGFVQFMADLKRLHASLERVTGRALRHSTANAACFDCSGRLVRLDHPERGLSDVVTCEQCHATYDSARYRLALLAHARAGQPVWLTVADAARGCSREVETLETWAKRLQVTSACRLSDRRKVVWWPSVLERLQELRERADKRALRKAEQDRRSA